jgi:hypothetical protein
MTYQRLIEAGRQYAYGRRYDYLIRAGFEPFEAHEFAKTYTMSELRHRTTIAITAEQKRDPNTYLSDMIKSRILYVGNLRRYFAKKGLSEEKISDRITARIIRLYKNKGWFRHGQTDPWQMLEAYRDAATRRIGKDKKPDYIPPPRRKSKGSHKKQGVGPEYFATQRAKYRANKKVGEARLGTVQQTLDRITALNVRMGKEKDPSVKAGLLSERNALWKTIA